MHAIDWSQLGLTGSRGKRESYARPYGQRRQRGAYLDRRSLLLYAHISTSSIGSPTSILIHYSSTYTVAVEIGSITVCSSVDLDARQRHEGSLERWKHNERSRRGSHAGIAAGGGESGIGGSKWPCDHI